MITSWLLVVGFSDKWASLLFVELKRCLALLLPLYTAKQTIHYEHKLQSRFCLQTLSQEV